MKRLISFLLFAVSIFASAQTTTFTANLKDLATNTPANPEAGPVYLELTLRNIGTANPPTLCRVNGVGLVSFPVNLYPVSGLISQPVYDETFISCGGSTGVSYYHIRMYQGDSTRSAIKKLLFEDDFDVEGATFNLNSAAPRSAAVITPPPATAVLTNPSGNQTVVQPGGTALSVNRLSAGFAQSANGADMIPGNRFTDTSPTGNFFNLKNAAGSTSLWQVDVSGTLQAGIIPIARLSTTPATGSGTTNTIPKYTNGGSAVIGNSSISDNGSTVTISEPITSPQTLQSAGNFQDLIVKSTTVGGTDEGLSIQNAVQNWAVGILHASSDSFIIRNITGSINPLTITTGGNATFTGSVTAGSYTNNLSAFAATTSAQLRSVISDETGTGGGLVFATAPAITNAALTTPAIGSAGSTFAGSTSGTTTLKASATASGTLTLPAATDTLVGQSTTDTLANKTLTSPVINGTPSGTGITTVTLKKGSGAGSYTSTSTSYVQVDGTNLTFTVTIPTGWKLVVNASFRMGTNTAAVASTAALADGGTVLVETLQQTVSAGTATSSSLQWVINGNGASHTIDLRYKTSNASDAVTIGNTTSTDVPTMVFILTPSN